MRTEGQKKAEVRQAAQERLAGTGLADRLTVLQCQQRYLRDNGFLVDIDVTGVSQMFARVDWYLDLGVPEDDTRRDRLTPGRKQLLPGKKLRSIETRVRRHLERHSHGLSAFPGYRYIPDTAFFDWLSGHETLVAEWEDEVNRLIDNYDEHYDQAREDFTAMARQTWLSLLANKSPFVKHTNLTDFTQAVVAKALSQMPTKTDIRVKTQIYLRPATFMLDVETESDLLEAARLQVARQEEYDRLDYFRRKEQAKAEAAEAESEAVKEEAHQQAFTAEVEGIEKRRVIRAKSEALVKAQLELARQAAQDMRSPFEEVVNGVRSELHQAVTEISQNVEKHGKILGKTSERLTNLLEWFRLFDHAGDTELQTAMADLQSAMSQNGVDTRRDTDAIASALQSVADIAVQEATEVADLTTLDGWDLLEL